MDLENEKIEKILFDILVEELELDKVKTSLDSDFCLSDYDSFDKINIIIALESYMSKEISIFDLMKCKTFKNVIDLVTGNDNL